jgi:peptide/nickel transport system permease protein
VLPLIAAPLLVEASFVLAGAVVAEAGLSFLGLGAQPPLASWGSMIRQAMQFLLVAPHMLIGPCLALVSLVLASNLLGDHLRQLRQRTGDRA